MSSIIKTLLHLNGDNIWEVVPRGAILEIAGTTSTIFTIAGKHIMLSDGTSSGDGTVFDLQSVYNHSADGNGNAKIALAVGKDLVVTNADGNETYFSINSTSGRVTISGDIVLEGGSSVIESIIQDADHWTITPRSGTQEALRIEPDAGVVPIVDLFSVRLRHGRSPTIRISPDGTFHAVDIAVSGTVDGVDVSDLADSLSQHITEDQAHLASSISVSPIPTLTATNVQGAVEELVARANSAASDTTAGVVWLQETPSTMWDIPHHANMLNCTVSVYDGDMFVVIPDSIQVLDLDTIRVSFGAPQSGRAVVTFVRDMEWNVLRSGDFT